MFEPVTKKIFRWGTVDPEISIMIYGHLLVKNGSSVLVDPPAVPGLEKMATVLGKPEAVIMTNFSHTRGCVKVSNTLGVPLYIPDVRGSSELKPEEEIRIHGLGAGIKYGEKTEMPLGLKAHYIRAEMPDGKLSVEEMALLHDDFLVVGDSAWGIDGKLNIFPTGVKKDEKGEMAESTRKALVPVIRKTGATGLLSGHMEDITEGLQGMVGK
ncbi:hypothetical protein IX51_10745 [uncultured archaeon]|nr:hypothetical protein IX51_10745 [uncultured archaeon]